jgi:hypothetical protein
MTTRRDREQGSALVLVLLVTMILLGLGLMAMRQSRTEQLSTGNMRASQQAYQVAQAGLVRSATTALGAPDEFHRRAIRKLLDDKEPTYTFGEEDNISTPDGIFTMVNSLESDSAAADSGDVDRLGLMEYRATMSRPRLSTPPAGYQAAGSNANFIAFYVYQFDVDAWINREDSLESIAPGTGGAVRRLRADVRIGPIFLNR